MGIFMIIVWYPNSGAKAKTLFTKGSGLMFTANRHGIPPCWEKRPGKCPTWKFRGWPARGMCTGKSDFKINSGSVCSSDAVTGDEIRAAPVSEALPFLTLAGVPTENAACGNGKGWLSIFAAGVRRRDCAQFWRLAFFRFCSLKLCRLPAGRQTPQCYRGLFQYLGGVLSCFC